MEFLLRMHVIPTSRQVHELHTILGTVIRCKSTRPAT